MLGKSCHACGAEYARRSPPGFRDECTVCDAPLHCCENCRFYEADSRQWCREPQARDTRPREPIIANLCDYFLFGVTGADDTQQAKEAKAKLAAMFDDSVDDDAPAETLGWMKVDKPPQKDIFGNEPS